MEHRNVEEKIIRGGSGMLVLLLNLLLMLASCVGLVFGILLAEGGSAAAGVPLMVVSGLWLVLVGPILFAGLKVIKPGEALVLTLFGQYYGTLKQDGFYFVNPFAVGVNPVKEPGGISLETGAAGGVKASANLQTGVSRKLSLKAMTLNNKKQKINDLLGNPIEIGIVVIWRVVDTAKAVFNVDNYEEYLSIQCDSALRNIVRLYPYDIADGDAADEKSLRGSSQEVAAMLKTAIQEKADLAGLEILEARITHLAYAPEIAAAMLQRQQAAAIIDARKMIVDGAVGMVEMALEKLGENNIVELDEERKAAMVSNLLVVLCGNRDAQPVVNSGSIY